MNLMPLEKLGPSELPGSRVQFGLYLPWVSAKDGNRLWLKVIHEQDQFLQHVQPKLFELSHAPDPVYSDYWHREITIDSADRSHPSSAWGQPGRYVYRFMLQNPSVQHEIDWIIDPFAREFGVGKLSAFTLGYKKYEWSSGEANWKTPKLSDLVVYEIMISEFGGSLDGAIEKLGYLADLGINCLEIMPVSNTSDTIDWGFLPIGYFGVDERFGKRRNMQRLVDEAHKLGIAVIFDTVYGHTGPLFPYAYVYQELGYHDNPFIGPFAQDLFSDLGRSTDYNRQITCDFFYTVNQHWLDCYHVDGFRYDCVPNYDDGATGVGYANLVYSTYQFVKDKMKQEGGYWRRFENGQDLTLIQCAEQLQRPMEIVATTYSNCTWQNGTLDAAKHVAQGNRDAVTDLGFRLGLTGYPETAQHNADILPKSALQYIENHDHSRFICNFSWMDQKDLLRSGDRSQWYKLQPYIIGLLTAKGIPVLWEGQEIGENYFLPDQGEGRVKLLRPVRWEYFYDQTGKAMIALFRKMLALRKSCAEFREGDYYFHNHYENYQSKGVLLFHRRLGSVLSLVVLNFSDQEQWVPSSFALGGNYQEMLHGADDPALHIGQVSAGETKWLQVPGNYGRVWRTV
ncbi:MAG: alpha-amylase family glycosyl hydrolase [Candidatus Electrothrix sp. Rat3]|nr:alpha-amylase family glycosyl hydrolase [Candidatus Electrothrix rattekaaiensis]